MVGKTEEIWKRRTLNQDKIVNKLCVASQMVTWIPHAVPSLVDSTIFLVTVSKKFTLVYICN